jgi:iron(III) transport system substrate-binding protein
MMNLSRLIPFPFRRSRVAAVALLCAGAAFTQASPAQDWNGILAGARKEGRVMFYTGQPTPVANRIAGGFRKMYPDIAVEIVRGPSGEVLAKVDQERSSGVDGADVFLSTEVSWFTERAREGKLRKPVGPALKNWPSQYLQDGTVAIVGSDPFVIIYNKNLVPNPPKTYAELLRPDLKGRLGTTELASTVLVAWYDWLEKTQGADFLQKLKAQNPRLYNGSTPLAQSVASGEIAVSAFGVPTAIIPVIEQGAPMAYVVPNPGMGNLYGMAALAWSKRPNAALVMADYIMSAEGQTLWHGRGESASPLSGIPGAIPLSSITPYDPAKYTAPVVAKYRDYWSKIFK